MAALLVVCPACAQPVADGSMDADALLILTPVEELRLGSLDDPDLGFSQITAVDIGADGNVYVLERLERTVRVYDPDSGTLLRKIGGQGSGPGEFETPLRFGVVRDTVWVYDSRLRRISFFDRHGDFLGSLATTGVVVETSQPGITARVRPTAMREDGLFTSSLSISGGRRDALVLPDLLFDATGAVVDTAGWDTLSIPSEIPNAIQIGGFSLPPPSAPSDADIRTDIEGDRVIIERSTPTSESDARFSVTRVDAHGDTVFHHLFRYQPQAFGGPARDTLVMRYVQSYSTLPGAEADDVEKTIRGAMVLPELQSPIASSRIGTEGTLWLRREERGEATYHWILIDPDGAVRGRLELGRSALVRWSSGDIAWVVEPDRFDVPWLVKYRIRE